MFANGRSFTTEITEGHGGEEGCASKDAAGNAVFQDLDVEVDEQTRALVGKPHVGLELRLVDAEHLLDRLEFDDHAVGDDKVDSETGVEHFTFVGHRQFDLTRERHSPRAQFTGQADLACRFQ